VNKKSLYFVKTYVNDPESFWHIVI